MARTTPPSFAAKERVQRHIAVIWDALKAASKSDAETAKLITESAGIIVGPPNLTVCYDERGEPRNHLNPLTFIRSTVLSCARSASFCVQPCTCPEQKMSTAAGAKYELPPYVLAPPTNLVAQETHAAQPGFHAGSGSPAELMSH